jgi:hypothetical protein
VRVHDDAISGLAEDWLPSDLAGLAHPEDDDENFERWLSSVPPADFEHLLDHLLDGPRDVPGLGPLARRAAEPAPRIA